MSAKLPMFIPTPSPLLLAGNARDAEAAELAAAALPAAAAAAAADAQPAAAAVAAATPGAEEAAAEAAEEAAPAAATALEAAPPPPLAAADAAAAASPAADAAAAAAEEACNNLRGGAKVTVTPVWRSERERRERELCVDFLCVLWFGVGGPRPRPRARPSQPTPRHNAPGGAPVWARAAVARRASTDKTRVDFIFGDERVGEKKSVTGEISQISSLG